MKKLINNKVLIACGLLIVIIFVSIGVFSFSNSSNNNEKTTNVVNRTQDEIKTKSNVATTPIVLPKEEPKN